MTERLLHYCWRHKMLPLTELKTTGGEHVEVIDVGLSNRNAGPDFFNAKVKIGATLWIGNVEIHCKSSDWYKHGHDKDSAYDNVILHIATDTDCEVTTSDGKTVPQISLSVPQQITDNYESLLKTEHFPPCYKVIPQLSRLSVRSWMSALQAERLERKTIDIEERVRKCGGSWEDAYFVTLARNFGFGVNSDAFEHWALNVGLKSVAHHRDNLMQVEAMFFGQAGLIDMPSEPQVTRIDPSKNSYQDILRYEYTFLSHKFGLKPMDKSQWRFMRMRPQNFPYIRISQLAKLYYERRTGISQLVECPDADAIRSLLRTGVTDFWQTHYTFDSDSGRSDKVLTDASLNLLIVNTAVPVLFAYGRHKRSDALCDRAFRLLEELKAESNHITRMWRECGMEVENAGDSQALIQLKNDYCDKKDCLRCRIGYEYLRHSDASDVVL
ncbi:MAG: DUF2851 family protein [Prevotella sp.]|nr:DUF2851 family protein [Prevotella sp.]